VLTWTPGYLRREGQSVDPDAGIIASYVRPKRWIRATPSITLQAIATIAPELLLNFQDPQLKGRQNHLAALEQRQFPNKNDSQSHLLV